MILDVPRCSLWSSANSISDGILYIYSLKRPNKCYILKKHGIQGYQIWHSCLLNLNAWDSKISNMTFPWHMACPPIQLVPKFRTICWRGPLGAIFIIITLAPHGRLLNVQSLVLALPLLFPLFRRQLFVEIPHPQPPLSRHYPFHDSSSRSLPW